MATAVSWWRSRNAIRRSSAGAPRREVGVEGGPLAFLVRVLELVEGGVFRVEQLAVPPEESFVDQLPVHAFTHADLRCIAHWDSHAVALHGPPVARRGRLARPYPTGLRVRQRIQNAAAMPGDQEADNDTVRYELDGHVATITYNRPEALNAINGEMRRDLNAAFARFRDDEDAWVAIVTGAGRAFCAGADMRDGAGSRSASSPARSGRSRRSTPSRAAGRSSSRSSRR